MPMTVCPNCQSPMSEVSRRGVYVDVCPRCRGVWLDGGELEKLLALAVSGDGAATDNRRYASADDYRRDHADWRGYKRDDDDDDDDDDRRKRRDRRPDDFGREAAWRNEPPRPSQPPQQPGWTQAPPQQPAASGQPPQKKRGGVFDIFGDLFD